MPLNTGAIAVEAANSPRENAHETELFELRDDPTTDINAGLERVDEDDNASQAGHASPELVDNLYLRDSGADDGEDDLPSTERQSNTWKIDHSSGHYRYKWNEFIAKANAPEFDGAEAIDLLQRPFTIDYGSRKAGSRPASDKDTYYPVFYLDFISVMGCPLKAITKRSERFFDNVTISFQKWSAPYSSKHGPKLPFDLAHRTFRLATGATREIWFIVMHPVRPNATGRPRRGAPSAHGTALAKHEAEPLASYIKSVFLSGELLGEGIEPSWILGGQQSQSITHNKWTAFQELFMDGWGDFVERYSHDPFWAENQPAFHAYDYGANIEIEVTEQVQSLEREARIRPDEDDEDEDEDEVENDGDDDDTEEEELYESDNPEDGDGPGDLGSRRGISASTTRIESPGLVVERNDRRGGEASLEGGMRDASASFEDGSERHESTPIPPSQREAQEALYSSGLRELRAELEQKYNIVHLESVSYALAVNLYCTAADSSSRGGESSSIVRQPDSSPLLQPEGSSIVRQPDSSPLLQQRVPPSYANPTLHLHPYFTSYTQYD
ncbi:Fc.00g034160.m01.CDS01 [Cosmosporella sp. VM-42]